MANSEHLAILKQGVEVWNKWREEHPKVRPDFEGADLCALCLEGANLSLANFKGAELVQVNLIGADLAGVDFKGANLIGANLKGAHLVGGSFEGADLRYGNLANAFVSGGSFDNTMRCKCINVRGCLGSQRFVRHVQYLDYIEETKEKCPKRYTVWKWTSDCGRSWERWAAWSVGIALLFGTVFLPSIWWESLPHWLQVALPHLRFNVPGMDVSFFTPYYFSIVTFTTLGFGDITPLNLAGQIWLTLEVVCGYIMLGGLITLFATKMVRQSG